MRLTGSLRDFGLAQALQLLAQQGRHGVMQVVERSQTLHLVIASGHLVAVGDATGDIEAPIVAALGQAELLDPLQQERLANIRKGPEVRLLDVLITQGWVESGVVAQLAQLQSTESLTQLLMAHEGHYAFEGQNEPPEGSHAPMRLEGMLLTIMGQTQVLSALRRRVPTLSRIFKTSGSLDAALARQEAGDAPQLRRDADNYGSQFGLAAAGDDGWDQQETPSQGGQTLGHAERLVFSLLDGDRDLRHVLFLSRLGEFGVLLAITHLEDAKLVTVVAAGEKSSQRPARQPILWRETARTMGMAFAMSLIILAVTALCLLSGLPVLSTQPRGYRPASLEALLWQAQTPDLMSRHAIWEAGAPRLPGFEVHGARATGGAGTLGPFSPPVPTPSDNAVRDVWCRP